MCLVRNMEFERIFTRVSNESVRYFGMNDHEDYIFYCSLNIEGVPENISENEKEKIYDNPELAVKIGRIDGWMILGRTMFEHDIDLYKECDAISGSLEFVCSALMENNGPVAANYMTDMFYIDEIEINEEYYSEDLFSEIIDELPDSLFTHYHVWSEILIYYPRPLPYEDKLEELEKELAVRAYSDVIDRNFNGNSSDEPHLIMSRDQFNIIAGRRRDGQSYPEVAKDTTLWERYEECGFEEWLNTRVMYKMID